MITQKALDDLESYLDKVWAQLDIDVAFTRHFLDRVNDPRNKKDIEIQELRKLFIETYKKYGSMFKKMAKKDSDIQGVLNDISTQINSPFVLKWDNRNREFDLVSKTVMRKKNFVPNNPKERKYTVEDKLMTIGTKLNLPASMIEKVTNIHNEGRFNRLVEEFNNSYENFELIEARYEPSHLKFRKAEMWLKESKRALISELESRPSLTEDQSELLGHLKSDKKKKT